MFLIDDKAAAYLLRRGKAATVELKYEPAIGG
jgi:hypothetical protein